MEKKGSHRKHTGGGYDITLRGKEEVDVFKRHRQEKGRCGRREKAGREQAKEEVGSDGLQGVQGVREQHQHPLG